MQPIHKWNEAVLNAKARALGKEKEDDLNRRDKARYFAELKEAREQEERKFGYCPKCFCLIRMNGKCDNCD